MQYPFHIQKKKNSKFRWEIKVKTVLSRAREVGKRKEKHIILLLAQSSKCTMHNSCDTLAVLVLVSFALHFRYSSLYTIIESAVEVHSNAHKLFKFTIFSFL